MRLAFAVVVCLAGLAIVLSPSNSQVLSREEAAGGRVATIITAEAFRLVDKTGRVRGLYSTSAGGSATLQLYDGSSNVRLDLAVLLDGTASIALLDAKGTIRARLLAPPNGDALVATFDARGDLEAELPRRDVPPNPFIHKQ